MGTKGLFKKHQSSRRSSPNDESPVEELADAWD